MSSQPILTSTDPSVDTRFPRVTGTTSGAKHALDVSVIASGGLLEGVVWDYCSGSYPDSVTEIYTYKDGGSGGTTTATVTVIYTTSSKQYLASLERT